MLKFGLYVRMEVKPGQEAAAEDFLRSAEALVQAEPETVGWFAIKLNSSTYGIFDVFENESGRKAHLSGKVASELFAKAPELFVKDPEVHMIDIIASKFPGISQNQNAA